MTARDPLAYPMHQRPTGGAYLPRGFKCQRRLHRKAWRRLHVPLRQMLRRGRR